MAGAVKQFELSKTPFSGDGRTRKHEYILRVVDMTDDQAIEWLTTPNASLFGISIQRPTGTFISSLPLGQAPLLFEYAGRSLMNVEYKIETDGIGAESSAEQVYKITADYSYLDGGGSSGTGGNPINGTSGITFSFEIGVENETYSSSIFTRGIYPPTGTTAPSFYRAINVQSDGTVEGVQVPDSPQQFTLEYTDVNAWFTAARRGKLTRLRGKVNDRDFTLGGTLYKCGEVRFLGSSGQISNTGSSTIQLRFGIRENVNNIQPQGIDHAAGVNESNVALALNVNDATGSPIFPGNATGIIKLGWDYLWKAYAPVVENGQKTGVRPRGAYVEVILDGANLNDIFA